MRYRQAVIVVKALFIILACGLFYIQIIRGDYYHNLSKKNVIRIVSLEASRGRILDRNGVVLADTIASFDIFVIPQEIKDKTLLFEKLSLLLEIPTAEFNANYRRNYLNPFIPVEIYEKLEKDKIIVLEENKLQLPGVMIEVRPNRYYPFNSIASHILGYLGRIDFSHFSQLKPYGYKLNDLVGYGGVEQRYDLVLRGEDGGEQIEVDNLGRKVRTVGYKPPKSGQDIQISIDIRIQQIVDEFMYGKRGAVVIMDPYSGEIISLSSHPNYNPNHFIKGRFGLISDLLEDKYSPLLNRATAGQYAPGSVFKIITATAALEKERLLINKIFRCDGNLKIGDRIFNCWSQHREESFKDAIVHSCNVYFYNLGLLIGPEIIRKYAYRLGLGRKTGIDLDYEVNGFIPSPKWKKIIKFQSWYKGDTANMSIGQGEILVTPLQLARLISIFANGGKLVRPRLIKAVDAKHIERIQERSVDIDKQTLYELIDYMSGVVDDSQGSAHIVKIEGLKIVGKTGTAQVSLKQPHGWFVGYVGRDKPRFAFCVFLEHGQTSYAACVIAKKILEEMFKEGLI